MSSFLQIVIHIHKPITCTFVTCLVINVLCIMNLPHNHNVLYQGVSPYRRTESMWISFQSINILPGWFLSLIALRNLFNQNRNFEYVGLEKKILLWPGYAQFTVRIPPLYSQHSSREADLLRIDFKPAKIIMYEKDA